MVLYLRICFKVGISCLNSCGVDILRYFYFGSNKINYDWIMNFGYIVSVIVL